MTIGGGGGGGGEYCQASNQNRRARDSAAKNGEDEQKRAYVRALAFYSACADPQPLHSQPLSKYHRNGSTAKITDTDG